MKSFISLTFLIFSVFAYGDDIKVYFNHDVNPPAQKADLGKEIVKFIETAAANSTVDVMVFDIDLLPIAQAMVDAKNNKGVKSRLITDNENVDPVMYVYQALHFARSNGINAVGEIPTLDMHAYESTPALKLLTDNGIDWLDDTADGSAGSGLQHNKVVIKDRRYVLMGSTNFTHSGIYGEGNGSIGNDNHILIIDSVELAEEFTNQFAILWGDGVGKETDSLFGAPKPDHFLKTVYTTNEKIKIQVQFAPHTKKDFENSALGNLGKWLDTAETRVRVAQFSFSSQYLADKMKPLSEKVEIQGIGDRSFATRYFSEFLDMAGRAKRNPKSGEFEHEKYTGLKNNVWDKPARVCRAALDDGDKWHHKYWIIENMVVTGSLNPSESGAFSNDEALVAIYDKETADEFEGHFSYALAMAASANTCL